MYIHLLAPGDTFKGPAFHLRYWAWQVVDAEWREVSFTGYRMMKEMMDSQPEDGWRLCVSRDYDIEPGRPAYVEPEQVLQMVDVDD